MLSPAKPNSSSLDSPLSPKTRLWRFTDSKAYSIKSGYSQVIKKDDCGGVVIRSIPGKFCKGLWKIKFIPKCVHFVWKVCKDILLVRQNLSRKGMDVDPICPRCAQAEEDIVNAFLLCDEVRRIWFASSLGGRIKVGQGSSFAGWFVECL